MARIREMTKRSGDVPAQQDNRMFLQELRKTENYSRTLQLLASKKTTLPDLVGH